MKTKKDSLSHRKIEFLFVALLLAPGLTEAAPARKQLSRQEQLQSLRSKLILVPTSGWPAEQMAAAAKRFGYEVVNAPHGNNLEKHKREAKIWSNVGLKMLVRPRIPVTDPFDPEQIRRGCEQLNKIIEFHDPNPDVVGFVIAWGLYGEGGFPRDYKFSEKARQAFNRRMDTPEAPLPQSPRQGQPGSLRWVRWLEFRSGALRDFRERYVASAKKHTDKLVGTWSEFYPTENYQLNMGDAPGADFLFYDLSFGDVTVDQTIAFGETHGDMQHYETFEAWREHELPLMAKAVGEGVIPIGFQFPMRRGYAADFLSKTTVFTDRIEDEYSLRIAPDIRKLTGAVRGRTRRPEVAVVYQSFAAGALPGGDASRIYQNGVRQIEGSLRQMGVDLQVIAYEHLASKELSGYKLVIVVDPMYLSAAMRRNLAKARRVLYCGEYLLTHHDPATAGGDFRTGWHGQTKLDSTRLFYRRAPAGKLTVANPNSALMAGVEFEAGREYPSDQIVIFQLLGAGTKVLVKLGEYPVMFTAEGGRVVHLANRYFHQAWRADSAWLEDAGFHFLRNLLLDCGVKIRVAGSALCRVKQGWPYGSYGLTGYVAWNDTGRALMLRLSDGRAVRVPAHGWTLVED